MTDQETTNDINHILLYLQEFASNSTMSTLILILAYDTALSLLHMGSVLKYLQALTSHPTAMLIPDIKCDNALFNQLLPLLPFEPRLAVGIQ